MMLHPPHPDVIDDVPESNSKELLNERKNVVHYVSLPDGKSSLEAPEFPEDPVMEYDFELDAFQRDAIACVHNNESVLVSAHTSAGKTAIALYAIQKAISQGSRVVYTSPIKALSNQKYRDLKQQFGDVADVGLITGDITLNPEASILVMTTEILRMMLYRAHSMIRELSWVIYDEIHYMKDVERGVVWEESIILLPDEVRFVFLSATIPNAREFSEWIARIHNQPCHVVYTEYRPTPLEFFLAPHGMDPVVARSRDGQWHDSAFDIAYSAAPEREQTTSKRYYHGVVVHQMKPPSKMTRAQKMEKSAASREEQGKLTVDVALKLVDRDLAPMIIFCFGRRECSELSEQIGGCFVDEKDTEKIETMFEMCIDKLTDSDKELPQIESLRKLLSRGIGIHHGGLIPLMKELVEVLFQYGYIKILIATETFAMGLNMPARTVLFHSLLKFDGKMQRLLTSGEFIQMSGRAGRRNNDAYGAVVITINKDVEQHDLKDLLKGSALPLNSEFHVTYHMILSLMSVTHELKPKELMLQSFHQFQMEREIPALTEEAEKIKKEAHSMTIPGEEMGMMLVEIDQQIEHFKEEMQRIVSKTSNKGSLLKYGRVVKINDKWGWGIVVAGVGKGSDVLVAIRCTVDERTGERVPSKDGTNASVYTYAIDVQDIEAVSDLVIDVNTRDPMAATAIQELFRRFDREMRMGDLVTIKEEMMIMDEEGSGKYAEYQENIKALTAMKEELGDIPSTTIALCRKKKELLSKETATREKIVTLNDAVMQKDLEAMQCVLKKMGMISDDGIVLPKGRVAGWITAGDELILTEMLYDGVLRTLTPQQIAALLTIFACDEGSKEKVDIPDDLQEAWTWTNKIIEKIVSVSKEAGISIQLDEYIKKFDPTYITLTYRWAGGEDFAELMKDSSFFEGSVIRTIKRTEEILRQTERAANEMGEATLQSTILAAINLIKRDIISAASLYL